MPKVTVEAHGGIKAYCFPEQVGIVAGKLAASFKGKEQLVHAEAAPWAAAQEQRSCQHNSKISHSAVRNNSWRLLISWVSSTTHIYSWGMFPRLPRQTSGVGSLRCAVAYYVSQELPAETICFQL